LSTVQAGGGVTADIGQILDAGPWTAMQKTVVFLGALSIVVDGLDGQLVGFAIPELIRAWHVTPHDFAPAVAAGLVGMGLGSAGAGLLADRIGRRWAIIVSVFVFGIATCLIGFSQNLEMFAGFRLLAGLGIGGALPSSTTMTAEYTPARQRTLAVTATIVCVPLGGMLAGVFASFVLPELGWRALFFIGGVFPLLLGLVLTVAMPESPRFLVRRPARWPELTALLGRMSRSIAPGTVFTDIAEQRLETRQSFPALFALGRARDTVAIWLAFFLCLLAVYSAFSWLPAMLVADGLNASVARSGLTAYNFGGVIGALACAVVIGRYGSRWPMIVCSAGAAGVAFFLETVNVTHDTGLLILGFGLHGLLVNAVQSTMFALSAYMYPTAVRATGTASALAFGRVGAIVSAFAGAAVITLGGGSGYLTMLGLAMVGTLVALAVIRRHIPPLSRQGAAAGVLEIATGH
jgi:MFS transporter, AAHS family, 4-hydroxybenzoate transporter